MVYELCLRRGLLATARSPVVRRNLKPVRSLELPVHAPRTALHVTGNSRFLATLLLLTSSTRYFLAERLRTARSCTVMRKENMASLAKSDRVAGLAAGLCELPASQRRAKPNKRKRLNSHNSA